MRFHILLEGRKAGIEKKKMCEEIVAGVSEFSTTFSSTLHFQQNNKNTLTHALQSLLFLLEFILAFSHTFKCSSSPPFLLPWSITFSLSLSISPFNLATLSSINKQVNQFVTLPQSTVCLQLLSSD